ncbi:hypothetical protein M1555_05340 [Patescibacteria group bacterium]|nr:hypothetical protein [Patescibacteria group bacterium]
MSEYFERSIIPYELAMPQEHGLYEFVLGGAHGLAISVRTFDEFVDGMRFVRPDDRFVVSPELITIADIPWEDVPGAIDVIYERIARVADRSLDTPGTVYVFGTPTVTSEGRLRNSAVFIRNGEIIGQTNKRLGAVVGEYETFEFPADEPAVRIPGTDVSVLICADIIAATLLRTKYSDRHLGARERQFNRLVDAHNEFVAHDAKQLLIVSCWGIGANPNFLDVDDVDGTYAMNLRSAFLRLFHQYPHLEEIVMVDRAPNGGGEELLFASSHPFNIYARREMYPFPR